MDTCKSRVWGAEPDDVRQCTRPAAWDGYCTQHHPYTMKKRSEAALARKSKPVQCTCENDADAARGHASYCPISGEDPNV